MPFCICSYQKVLEAMKAQLKEAGITDDVLRDMDEASLLAVIRQVDAKIAEERAPPTTSSPAPVSKPRGQFALL